MHWDGEIITAPKSLVPENLIQPNSEHHLVMDSTRIRSELGYTELKDLKSALTRTIEWERAHPPENLDPRHFDYAAEDAALLKIERARVA